MHPRCRAIEGGPELQLHAAYHQAAFRTGIAQTASAGEQGSSAGGQA